MKRFIALFLAALVALACDPAPKGEPVDDTVAVEGISLDKEFIEMETSNFQDIVATVSPADATDTEIVWTSDNEAVATVTGGTIVSNGPGTAVITASTKDGSVSAKCTVVVTIPLKSISIDPAQLTLGERETAKLTLVYPENATHKPVVWATTDEAVVAVDQEGTVTGVATGSAVVTAKTEDGKLKATCSVTVKKVNLPWSESPDGKMYPAGVTVTWFKDQLDGENYCQGAYAHIDFSVNPDLRFNVLSGSAKTLIGVDENDKVDWYDQFPEKNGAPIILTNAGFFFWDSWSSSYQTSSLIGLNGAIKANGASTTGLGGWSGEYYPVRSALSIDRNGKFSINWVYPTGKGVYAYPSALDQNDKTGKFLPSPPGTNVAGCWKLEYKDLMQGGPRLVENGMNVAELNTRSELLTGTTGEPHGYRTSRTAVGIKPDGSIIMLVCEGDGRNGKANAGFDACELADKFIELGCIDALGFDGGGSSEMIGPDGLPIANRIGKPRAMPTALCVSEIRYE